MNILITGASGFLGSEVTRALLNAGHHVTCCVRNIDYTKKLFPHAEFVYCDFLKDISVDDWLPRLNNIDIVINTVGIFHHPNKKNIWKTHYQTPKAMFEACRIAKVKKIIQISALGVDKVLVDYAQSKKAADDFLISMDMPAFILRPSLIYGKEWNGGMALLLALASLPGIIPLPGKGDQQFQPIYLPDLAKAIATLIEKPTSKPIILAAVSPAKITLTDMLFILHRWLGLAKAILVSVPLWLIRLSSLPGNLISGSVLNSTSYQMMMQNNVTTEEKAQEFIELIGETPRTFEQGIFNDPRRKSDKWQARMFFFIPVAKLALAFMWIASAVCSAYFYPIEKSYALLANIGIASSYQPLLVYGASFLNLALGLGLFTRWVTQVYWLQLFTIIIYTMIITFALPELWLEPFGPVVKNVPILALICLLLNLDDRK